MAGEAAAAEILVIRAATQSVASVQALMSSSFISQKGFITLSPASFRHAPLPSRAVAPELMRWMNPSFATPSGRRPVTRSQASGLQ